MTSADLGNVAVPLFGALWLFQHLQWQSSGIFPTGSTPCGVAFDVRQKESALKRGGLGELRKPAAGLMKTV